MDQIILRAYHPNKEPEVVICPLPDGTGNTYTGQGEKKYFELLTPKERRDLSTEMLQTPQTKIKLISDYMFDIKNNEMHNVQWRWVQKHPYIDLTKRDVPSNDAIFYVYNKQTESAVKVTRSKRITNVMHTIYNLSLDEKRTLSEALGLGDSSGFSEVEVEDWLEQKTNSPSLNAVETLLEKKADGGQDIAALKLYHEALNKEIIKRYPGGWYKYGGDGGVSLGRSEELVVQYFLSDENSETVIAIRADIEELKS